MNKKIIMGAIIATMCTNVYASDFKDLDASHWANNSVKTLVQKQVINGYEDGTFRPDSLVTRAEFATMIVKALGISTDNISGQTFIDVDKNDWEYKFVEAAKGYLTGYKDENGNLYFKSSEPALREDMAAAVVLSLGLSDEESNIDNVKKIFSDSSDITSGFEKYIDIAYKNNIISGYTDGTFGPKKSITRAEAAALISKTLEKKESLEKVLIEEEVKEPEKVIIEEEIEKPEELEEEEIKEPEVEEEQEKVEIKVVYGDVNSDGKINSKDAIMLSQYLDGNDVNISIKNADVNTDNKVDKVDYEIINKYVAQQIKELPYTGKIEVEDEKEPEEEVKIVYGDVNSDGKINSKDAIMLSQYLDGNDVNISIKNADVNTDNKIDKVDYEIINKYVAQQIKELPYTGKIEVEEEKEPEEEKQEEVKEPEVEVKIVYGDVNSDGKINSKDAIMLSQYLDGNDVNINIKNADVNTDNKVDKVDYEIMNKYVAQQIKELPYTGKIEVEDEKEPEKEDVKEPEKIEEDENIVYGDVFEDGKINNKDTIMLSQYLNGNDVNANIKNADVNSDNKVDQKDLDILNKYVAKQISELPYKG